MAALFSSEVALLTGATSGIGAAIARGLLTAGVAGVVINGRDHTRGEVLAERLRAETPGAQVVFVAADVVTAHEAARVVSHAHDVFGRIDIFVHCVGAEISARPFVDIPIAAFAELVNGHFMSLLHCCHAVVPIMTAQKAGVILTVASDAAKTATPGESVIGAMKAAVAMFTRTLALEVARSNVRANCLTPSIVRDTLSYERVMANEFSRQLFQKAEARARLGVVTPADIAPIAVFLASAGASKITGQTISVNGGISAV